MEIIERNSKKMSVKDLVTTGIFSAIFLVFTMVGGFIFASNPVLTFCLPCCIALLTGPIYLLLIAKVQKKGSITILGILMGFFIFITGMYWLWAIFYIVLGIVGDLIASTKQYKSVNVNILSFVVFSLNPLGSYMMLWIDRTSYFSYLTSKGTEQTYVDIMGSTAQSWMLPVMVLSILIAAIISALVGKLLLKKQFEKAGITL